MSHVINTLIAENIREDKEFYEERAKEYRAMNNREAVDLARKLAHKATERAHKIEGYTHYAPDHIK